MTIGIIEFKGGFEANLSPETYQDIVGSLIRENAANIELLPEGNYDVTPPWWKRHTHNHNLTVLDSGKGIYRMTPRESGVGYLASDTRRYSNGGTNINLPEERNIAVIAGPSVNKRISVCALIIHVDGPNPSMRGKLASFVDSLGGKN